MLHNVRLHNSLAVRKAMSTTIASNAILENAERAGEINDFSNLGDGLLIIFTKPDKTWL
ncbi:MAG: hypothetical protein V7K27_08990 [Nostoc sp.]|uniref:hypothetical protein n=1 Tax=Nostoc sp. TaxID=1180 RepID=UPI002FF58CEC